ncbi:MAG: tetratricopeptide repeat protein [Desulfobacteraceae bacterium]|jgi:TPR repeat protein
MTSQYLYNQSLNYLEGNGVTKEEVESFRLNAKAAESGHHDAVLAMGWYYLNGIGVNKDVNEAVYWYKKAARQGEPKAMFSLGQIAYDQHNDIDAMKWFERAFKKNHFRSQYWIGKLYWHGRGVEQDKKKGVQLFNLAAKRKVKKAKRTLKWLSRLQSRTSR